MSIITGMLGKFAVGLIGRAVADKVTGRQIPPNSTEIPSKGAWQSKTVWGVLLASLGPVVAQWVGLDVVGLEEIVSNLSVIGGSLFAIYGRWTAAKPIG